MHERKLLAAYDAVLSDIYEAALVPAHWDVALSSLINHFSPPRWDVAMLVWERLHPATGRFIGAAGVSDFARAGYIAMFAGRQPWSVNGHALPVGQVVHSDEIVPRDIFKRHDFYTNFLANWEDEVAIIASLDRHGQDHLGLCMPAPDVGDSSLLRQAVTRLVPHIQRASRISRRIGEADLRAANAEAGLDASPSIILTLGPDMELLHANRQAQEWLGRTQGARQVQQRLRFADKDVQQRLANLAKGMGTNRTENITIGDELRTIFLVAMRVDPGVSADLAGANGGAAVLLVGGGRRDVSVQIVERLRDWFDLTPSEAKIAAYIADGKSLEEYASDRGVSVNAARFLIKGVFAKTGVRRQAELAALLREAPLDWHNPIDNFVTTI
ncbi:MAG: helix-turn-helix transcriptional regulator [Sphingomonadaceae bacterium]|nr:helix-turn-helix transcriptional regulator [Sphingomonadaceae bacterium]